MAISIYKSPPPVVFSGNPIIFGVKDTGALAGNAEQHGIYRIRFTQGIVNAYAIEINYAGSQFYFQSIGSGYFGVSYKAILPLKGSYTLTSWVAQLALVLEGDLNLNDSLYVKSFGSTIFLAEREIKGDISVRINVYIIDQSGSNYATHGIYQASVALNQGEFHAIGCKPHRHITFNLATTVGVIETLPEEYGDGVEQETEVFYTDTTNPLARVTDGSLYADIDVHELVDFRATGHFDLTADYLVRDLAQVFSIYFFKVSGSPKVSESGLHSDTFRVIDAVISKTHQAALNEQGISLFQYMVNNKMPLTWAPDNKVIDIYQPERLYFLMPSTQPDMLYRCKEYFSDGTDATHTVATISALQYQVLELSAAFLVVRSASAKTLIRFELWLETSGGVNLMDPRTYIMSYDYQPWARYWMAKNNLGVYECFRTTGPAEKIGDISKVFVDKELPQVYTSTDRQREQVSSNTQLAMKCSTGPLDTVWARYTLELLDSEDCYLLQSGKAIPADIQADKFSFGIDGENIIDLAFEAFLTTIDEDAVDTTIVLPVEGEYTKDFDEGFLIGNT